VKPVKHAWAVEAGRRHNQAAVEHATEWSQLLLDIARETS
jgi:hypothetical protein